MLTLKDRLSIEKIVAEQLKSKFAEAFRLLPSKEVFLGKMDELVTELKNMRQSQELHAHDHKRLDNRVTVVEKRLGITPKD
jgi:hypothetical protein